MHDSSLYPDIARGLPRGRFFHMPVVESDRERLIGVVSVTLARAEHGVVPPALAAFEVDLRGEAAD